MSKFKATLTSGRSYTLLIPNADTPRSPTEIVFKANVPVTVDASVKALLEEHAVEDITIQQGNKHTTEKRNRFTFEEVRTRPAPEPKAPAPAS